MYAVIKTGGKQFRVEPGMRLKVEKIEGEQGSTVEFEPLMIRKEDGAVEFNRGKVVAEILSHGRGKKVTVFKYKPKKNYKRWKGHRQPYTEILIREIKL
ncbi:MAG TPA: 50S ribosomal protein L21 [Aquifex aeolicus]|uniref:Large ribosomal subunit protein bL21 n=1 Tax=Aquifex aeolicus TaxID=63363 RepID=A0A7C5L453_AQUAO|nr:50S ribosomal protein L21 [Aquifex aeolicus]